MQKTKWLSHETLQIAENRREAKGKGEKEGYTHLNAEFQRIATRRDKKAFLCEQYKEIEENNRIGKTRGLFKQLEITRAHFMQRGAQKRTETLWTEQKQKILRKGSKNTQKNYTKEMLMTKITVMV